MLKIYEASEKSFSNNGLGTMQVISCIEKKAVGLAGWSLDCIVESKYSDLIVKDRIVTADTKEHGSQPFRIGNIIMEGRRIRFTANHVCFDAERYILSDSRPTNLGPIQFVSWVNSMTDRTTPFTISGDATAGIATEYFIRKTLLDALIEAQELFDVIIDPFGFQLRVMKKTSVGSDTGFKLAYGKNIQGATVEMNWNDVCTKVLPVGSNGLTLPEVYRSASVQYSEVYAKVVQFQTKTMDDNNESISESAQQTELRKLADAYLAEHQYPKISYKIDADVPQNLATNDVVIVKHPFVDMTVNVKQYEYDVENHLVRSIEFGNYDENPGKLLERSIETATSDLSAAIENTALRRVSNYSKQVDAMIQIISNGMGMFETKQTLSNGGVQYFWHNKPNKADSDVIYTLNSGGFAVSTDGGATYNAGMDSQGNVLVHVLSAIGINADWINAGSLSAGRIGAGTIEAAISIKSPRLLNQAGDPVLFFTTTDDIVLGADLTTDSNHQGRIAGQLLLRSFIHGKSTAFLPVYCLYNNTDHYYTTSTAERQELISRGWQDMGIQFYAPKVDS